MSPSTSPTTHSLSCPHDVLKPTTYPSLFPSARCLTFRNFCQPLSLQSLFINLNIKDLRVGKMKETIGIIGLDVVLNARVVLISLCTKTLHKIKAVLGDEGYRKFIKSSLRHRLKVCEEEKD
ncbi:hypothetical protein Sjap_017890 [Stephania japonica]|uniref:Uncharacterized protein n=1 Tax=Stephania japonica TaxID=461633 RepID=A0AAP0I739_9MAGN